MTEMQGRMLQIIHEAGLDDPVLEYLTGAAEQCEDEEELLETIKSFVEDEAAANELRMLLWQSTKAGRSASQHVSSAAVEVTALQGPVVMRENNKSPAAEQQQAPQERGEDDPDEQDGEGGESAEKKGATKKGTKKPRKQKAKGKSKDEKPVTDSAARSQLQVSNDFEAAQVQELEDNDDWSSAWNDVKASGERWGGRGKGGRGVQRSTFQPKDVFVEGVTLAYHGAELLVRTTIHFTHPHRYGIIGKNGVGKTTLLRRIATQTLPGFPLHLRCFLVKQEIVGDERSCLQTVMDSDSEANELNARLDALTENSATEPAPGYDSVADEIQDLCEKLAELDVQSAEGRASKILKGLGFSQATMDTSACTLSGGWRMRLALACALYMRPDILMLDEPTNHLDLEGIIWLQEYLQKIDSTVLLVSHDRAFLDAVCTDIVHFHKQSLHYYPGNYSDFERIKNDDDLKMQRMHESMERQRKHIEDSIQKMHGIAKNSNSKSVTGAIASRKKKLERHGMEKNVHGHRWKAQTENLAGRSSIRAGSENENALGWTNGKRTRRSLVDRPDKLFKFSFPEPEPLRSSGPLVQIGDLTFGYLPDKPLFRDVTLEITLTSKIGLVGKNGCGKSTLLKIIAGEQSSAGDEIGRVAEGVYRHPNLKICHFTQHHQDHLPYDRTALEHMAVIFPGVDEQALRTHLGSFGLGDLALSKIGTLSGGQKSRLVFAELTYAKPHLLLLDEPTNHLDFDTIEAVKAAIEHFNGGVVAISHNQSFISETCSEIYLFENKQVRRLECEFEEYVENLRSTITADM